MTKKLKSVISLLTALCMVLSVSIGAFAAVDIGRYASGNNDGRLITADMTITYGDGETMNDAAFLGDGFHYTLAETKYYSLDLSNETDTETLQVGTGYNKNAATGYTEETTGTVTLTEDNNIIEFEWLGEQNIKRLEMWIWPLCAIKTYEIQYFDGSEWVKHAEGELDQTQYVPVDPDKGATDAQLNELKSAAAYIMTFDEVTTTKLRFVATSFQEGVTSAKIAEAVPRSNHNVNLLAEWTLGFSGNTNGWLDGVGTSSSNGSGKAGWNRFSSPYAGGFANSYATGINNWTYQSSGSNYNFWPAYSYNRYSGITVSPAPGDNTRFAYSLRFPNAPQKISKIVFNMSGTEGTVKEFQIWYNNTDVEYALGGGMRTSTPDEAADSNWELAATVSGTFEKSSTTEIYLPEGEAAEYWMIKVTKWEGSPSLACPKFYVIPDGEISKDHISYAAKHIFDDVQTDTEDSQTASREIMNLATSFDYADASYNVEWKSSKEDLFDVTTGKVAFHEEEEQITLTAKLTSVDDDSISYTVSRDYTLLPRENECTITVDGEETKLLTDGFLFSAYDAKKEGISASEAPEKFVEIDEEGAIIDYSWFALNKSTRLEAWVYPVGAIDKYEIQSSEDGIVYNTVKEGSLFDTTSDESGEYDNASYYPILFERQDTKYLRFIVKSFAEGFDEAYISEAKFINTNEVDLNAAPKGAEGSDIGSSHYTSSYVVSNTSDEDLMFRKNNSGVWPVYEGGTSPSVTPDGGEIWYATGFNLADVKINRIAIPFEDGTAKEIEILCANGEESGFDMSSSFPQAPDTVADWKSVAVVRGSFSTANSPVIDLIDAPVSKYWMVKVKGASASAKMGRVQFYVADEADLSPVAEISKVIFDSVTTDTDSDSKVKLKMGIFDTYEYEGKEYSVAWESTNKLVDTETGDISEHEPDDKTTMTAIISDPENPSVSYCVTKDYTLEGMLKITLFKGEEKTPDTGILNDGFTYTAHDKSLLSAPANAYYNPDKFVRFDSVDSGFEFHWDKARPIRRLQMWLWPADSITDYEIQISDDGNVWETCHTGTFEDQYASDPEARPAHDDSAAGSANFYPVVLQEATKPVQHVRFVIKGFREPEIGAYVAEAYFHDTNDINYLALKTVPGTETHNSYKARSKYVTSFYASDSTGGGAAYRRATPAMWPVWSSSGQSPNLKASPDVPEYSYYATSFQGPPVLVNKASITIATGEAFEIEVKCAETLTSGFKWADYPPCPDITTPYKTVARISGKVGKGTHEFHFDNDFKSKHWMIKITQATGDFTFSGLGLYEIPVSELNPSSFALEGIFDGVSDTALDNVVKEKFNLPATVEKNGETFDIIWNYDSSMVNSDGTVIPALEDREMLLKASVGSPDEPYKHVLEKSYFILGQDSSSRTTICSGENISVTAGDKVFDSSLEHGFTFTGKKELEIDFASLISGGKVTLMAGEEKVLDLTVKNNKIIANEGTDEEATTDFAEKIKVDIADGKYSLSSYNGVYYKVVMYNQNLLSRKSFDKVVAFAGEGETMAIDNLTVKVVSTALFDSIEEQFDFAKLSPSYRATNLNGNLNLIDKVGDVTFVYETDDSGIIDITTTPGTGIVDLSAPGESYITVTATGIAANDSFTKTFRVLTGKDNLFGKAKSASPAAPVQGSNTLYAADGSLETAFVTTSGAYRINIDLQEVKAFSKLRIFEADTTAKITEFKIEASNDNVDFVEIYNNADSETKGIDSNSLITVPYTEARFIRISITKTSGSGENGILDICAYSDMSDEDKLKNDYDTLVNGLEIKNGTVISKTGKFGTQFTLISNTPAVTISETADKTGWKVSAVSSSAEINASVTLNATNGTASAEPKNYSFVIFADTNIRDNVVSGSGSSGGGGGGSSKGSSGSVPIATQPSAGSYTDSELAGHWGANEIKNLVMKGIVQGDGKSLNLSSQVTRAEFCKMIVAALGLELESHQGTFFDVSENDWFAKYAETAFKNGIMSGDDNGFRGNDVISRQEMAVVLVKALRTKLPEITTENEVAFTDGDTIAAWASDYVKLAAGLNLLKGYDTGDFKPANNLRRDEAMVVVYRLLSQLEA